MPFRCAFPGALTSSRLPLVMRNLLFFIHLMSTQEIQKSDKNVKSLNSRKTKKEPAIGTLHLSEVVPEEQVANRKMLQ